jgi:hypothetical protein
MTEEDLDREVYTLGETIEADALALSSKTLTDDDRKLLQRQLIVRVAQEKLLQQQLDGLFA